MEKRNSKKEDERKIEITKEKTEASSPEECASPIKISKLEEKLETESKDLDPKKAAVSSLRHKPPTLAKTPTPSAENKIFCQSCQKLIENTRELRNLLIIVYRRKTLKPDMRKSKGVWYFCRLCMKRFKNVERLHLHLVGHFLNQQISYCITCQDDMNDRCYNSLPIPDYREIMLQPSCSAEAVLFTKRRTIDSDSVEDPWMPIKCSDCGKPFDYKGYLTFKSLDSNTQTTFDTDAGNSSIREVIICLLCPTYHEDEITMAYHVECHLAEKNLYCKFCREERKASEAAVFSIIQSQEQGNKLVTSPCTSHHQIYLESSRDTTVVSEANISSLETKTSTQSYEIEQPITEHNKTYLEESIGVLLTSKSTASLSESQLPTQGSGSEQPVEEYRKEYFEESHGLPPETATSSQGVESVESTDTFRLGYLEEPPNLDLANLPHSEEDLSYLDSIRLDKLEFEEDFEWNEQTVSTFRDFDVSSEAETKDIGSEKINILEHEENNAVSSGSTQ